MLKFSTFSHGGVFGEQVQSQLAQAVKVFKEKENLAHRLEGNMNMLASERRKRAGM